jgi:hypothetical protein
MLQGDEQRNEVDSVTCEHCNSTKRLQLGTVFVTLVLQKTFGQILRLMAINTIFKVPTWEKDAVSTIMHLPH